MMITILNFPSHIDSTLTLSNLTNLLGHRNLNYLFDIPIFSYWHIMHQHSTMTEQRKALCGWYLANHPAPSWGHIAHGLYEAGQYAELKVLRDQVWYLKGQLRMYVHIYYVCCMHVYTVSVK